VINQQSHLVADIHDFDNFYLHHTTIFDKLILSLITFLSQYFDADVVTCKLS
jgi:hypothetical protein